MTDRLLEKLDLVAHGRPSVFRAKANPVDYLDAAARIRRLEAELAAAVLERDQAEEAHSKTISELFDSERARDHWTDRARNIEAERDEARRKLDATIRAFEEVERTSDRVLVRAIEIESTLFPRIVGLEAELARAAKDRDADRALLRRVVRYVVEDGARTPGATRLARLVEKIRHHLGGVP